MDTLQSMKLFLKVVEHGSYTEAARVADTTIATVSRAVSELEQKLGARLLQRTTRKIGLTGVGARYRKRCLTIIDRVEHAELELSNADAHVRDRPAGILRVHAEATIGADYILPFVAPFQRKYPRVKIELTLSQAKPTSASAYDVIIGGEDEYIALKGHVCESVGQAFALACASSSYLRHQGHPSSPRELAFHSWVCASEDGHGTSRIVFSGPFGDEVGEVSFRSYSESSTAALAAALCEGRGIGILPAPLALSYLRARTLIRVVPEYAVRVQNMVALYRRSNESEPKLRAWIEFLAWELSHAL